MKKLLLGLVICLLPSLAYGQCTGVFDANTLCGRGSTAGPPTSIIGGTISGSVKSYGASGSAQTTTGTANAGSTTLTLAAPIDFQNKQGILILGAGPTRTATVPCFTGAGPVNGTGATTYDYRIAGRDNNGGITETSPCPITIANGQATLGAYQAGLGGIVMNQLLWNAQPANLCTVVWRSKNSGPYELLGCFTGLGIYDAGLPAVTLLGIPSTPPVAETKQWLATTIVSGAGSTTVTIANATSFAVSSAIVQHDDTAAINTAAAANTSIFFPTGTYNVRGLVFPLATRYVFGNGSGNSIINSFAQDAGGLTAGVSISANFGAFTLSEMKIAAAYPMSYNAFSLNQGNNSKITDNEFIGSIGLVNINSTNSIISRNTISGWWNVGIADFISTSSIITNNSVGNITAQVGAVALNTTVAGSNYQYGTSIWSDFNSANVLVTGNSIDQRGGSFGLSLQGGGGQLIGNEIKSPGRECIAAAVKPNVKVTSNRCVWSAAGNGNLSAYDFGLSVSDDTVNPVINIDISDNLFVNPGFSAIAVFGNGGANTYTNVNISGNTIAGANQLAGAGHQCGIELSGSNVSKVYVGTNTFQSITANMTYNVCEQNSGGGTPNTNTVDFQLGESGSSGTVNILGAASVFWGTQLPIGRLLYTNQAAPASPSAGRVISWADSTDLRLHDKNSAGTIGTTVVADTGASNNFLTAISAAGVISKAQPATTNLSDIGTFSLNTSGTIKTSNTTDSTSITTGALQTAGGLGITKTMYIGGVGHFKATAASSSTGPGFWLDDNSPATDRFFFGADAVVADSFRIFSQLAGQNLFQFTANATPANSTTTIQGSLTLTGTATISGLATDATHTDRTVCQDTTSKTLFFGSGAAGICLGTSSARFKRDIVPMHEGLVEIMKVKTKAFYYKKGYGDDGARLQYGILAEDLAKIWPKAVGYDGDNKPNTVDWPVLIYASINAIQELKAENDNIRRELDQFKKEKRK